MHALSRGGSRQGTAHRCAKGLPPLLHLHRQDPEESETGGGGEEARQPSGQSTCCESAKESCDRCR